MVGRRGVAPLAGGDEREERPQGGGEAQVPARPERRPRDAPAEEREQRERRELGLVPGQGDEQGRQGGQRRRGRGAERGAVGGDPPDEEQRIAVGERAVGEPCRGAREREQRARGEPGRAPPRRVEPGADGDHQRDGPGLVAAERRRRDAERAGQTPTAALVRGARRCVGDQGRRVAVRDGRHAEAGGVGQGRAEHAREQRRPAVEPERPRRGVDQQRRPHGGQQGYGASHGEGRSRDQHGRAGEPEGEREPARAGGVQRGDGREALGDDDPGVVVVADRAEPARPHDSDGRRADGRDHDEIPDARRRAGGGAATSRVRAARGSHGP